MTLDYTVPFIVNGVCLALTGVVMYIHKIVTKASEMSNCCQSKPLTVEVETKVLSDKGVAMETRTKITMSSGAIQIAKD